MLTSGIFPTASPFSLSTSTVTLPRAFTAILSRQGLRDGRGALSPVLVDGEVYGSLHTKEAFLSTGIEASLSERHLHRIYGQWVRG